MRKTLQGFKIFLRDSFDKYKTVPDFVSVIHRYRWAYFAFCIKPFGFTKIDGRNVMVYEKPGFKNITVLACEAIILTVTYIVRWRSIESPEFFTVLAFTIQVCGIGFSVLITQTIFLFTHRHFAEIFSSLQSIDTKLGQLRIKSTYNVEYYFSNTFALFLPLPWGTILMSNKPMLKKICDLIGYCYPIVSRFILIFVLTTIIMGFTDKYKQLNKLLDRIDESSDEPYGKKPAHGEMSVRHVLWKVHEIHNDLTECCKIFVEGFQHIILINISYNFFQFVFIIYYIYVDAPGEMSLGENVVALVGFSLQMAVLFYTTFLLEQEAKNTFVLLGLLQIDGEDVSTKRNSMLLQGLHNQVEFTVCELFPLHLSIFSNQLSLCNSFILVLIQNK